MSDKDKKLKLDLDFLGKDAPEKVEKKPEPKAVAGTTAANFAISDSAKWIVGAVVVAIVLIALAVSATGGSESVATETSTLPPPAIPTNDQILENIVSEKKLPPPAQKTNSQICKENYGTHSYYTGEKDSSDEPICDCNDGYQWDGTHTICVVVPKEKSALEICQDRNGSNATYDSASNSCGCGAGYSLSATSNQCVDALQARDDSCAAAYPGTSFLKHDTTTGKNVCDCKAGYDWNNDRTACYTTTAFTQSCVDSYGTGSVSTVSGGKRYCDCGYGYDFNPGRTMCVTTASINAICERDVGRNSRYSGSSTDGKYNCTEPY